MKEENPIASLIHEPTKENFLPMRETIITHPDFNPHAHDNELLEKLIEEKKYEEATDFAAVNTFLNPQINLIKSELFEKMNKPDRALFESLLGKSIIEAILDTGTGTIDSPYKIIRTSDEYMVIMSMGEQFASQKLVEKDGRAYDCVTTASQKTFYFEVTHIFEFMKNKFNFSHDTTAKEKSTTSWGKFW